MKLVCCCCGKSVEVEDYPISFGFELYDIAQKANMKPVIDLNYGRTLVFCSKECIKLNTTKRGYIRKNIIRKEKTENDLH